MRFRWFTGVKEARLNPVSAIPADPLPTLYGRPWLLLKFQWTAPVINLPTYLPIARFNLSFNSVIARVRPLHINLHNHFPVLQWGRTFFANNHSRVRILHTNLFPRFLFVFHSGSFSLSLGKLEEHLHAIRSRPNYAFPQGHCVPENHGIYDVWFGSICSAISYI